MSFLKSSMLVGTLLLAITITPASAGLIDHGTYVDDSSRGLSWLKLNILAGYSYPDVQAGALGYTTSGWRLATGNELFNLFTAYVGAANGMYSGPNSALDPSYFANATDLVVALGLNIAFNDARATYNIADGTKFHLIAIQGFYDDGGVGPNYGIAEAGAVDNGSDAPYGRWVILPNFRTPDWGGTPNVSAFLVRDTTTTDIPEPSVLAIFAFGLLWLWTVSGTRARLGREVKSRARRC